MSAYQPQHLIQERIEQKDKSPLYLKIADSVKLATKQQMLKVETSFLPSVSSVTSLVCPAYYRSQSVGYIR